MAVTWTPISDAVIAALVAQVNTFAAIQTFSEIPVFSKGLAANNSYIQARNAAGDGNVDLIKATAGDKAELGVVTTLPDTSKLATSGAPAADAQIANKKYIDDQLSASVPDDDAFGSWVSRSNDTVYQAASDGFVCATATPENALIKGYTDGSNPPTTLRTQCRGGGGSANDAGITMPVKKDDYWTVTSANTVYWLPIGA